MRWCFLRNLYAGQESTVRTGHGITGWFQIEKGVTFKAVYCHPGYLTYMQSTSWEMLGWRKHKLESKLPWEMSTASDMQWYHSNGRKRRSWHLVSSLHGKQIGKQWQALFSWSPKSMQMVTTAMKLKDTCSLEEKLWPTRQHVKKQRHYFANKGPSNQS